MSETSSIEFLLSRLDAWLKAEKESRKDFYDSLSLAVYSKNENNDLYSLAKQFNTNEIIKLIKSCGGKTIRIPTEDEFLHSFMAVIVFILYRIEKLPRKFIIERLKVAKHLKQIDMRRVFREVNNMSKDLQSIILKFSHSIETGKAIEKFDLYATKFVKEEKKENGKK